jgi:hypothetical protein
VAKADEPALQQKLDELAKEISESPLRLKRSEISQEAEGLVSRQLFTYVEKGDPEYLIAVKDSLRGLTIDGRRIGGYIQY